MLTEFTNPELLPILDWYGDICLKCQNKKILFNGTCLAEYCNYHKSKIPELCYFETCPKRKYIKGADDNAK